MQEFPLEIGFFLNIIQVHLTIFIFDLKIINIHTVLHLDREGVMSDGVSDRSVNVTRHLDSDSVAIERGAAESVNAMLEMGFGSLDIQGGADAMMEGIFEYGDSAHKPNVSYEIEDDLGRLTVCQPKDVKRFGSEKQSSWSVFFNREVPLDLDLKVASGATSVDLSETKLTALRSKVASGQFATTLTGSMNLLERIVLRTASGRTDAILNGAFPKLADCAVSSASGIATIALGGTFPVLDTLDVRTASGAVDLGLAGDYPALGCISIDAVSGTVDLNLVDATFSGMNLVLNCVSGEHVIRCPRVIGIGIRFNSLTGQITAPDFRRVKGMFVNDLYDGAETPLEINVSSVSGRISVQLGSI